MRPSEGHLLNADHLTKVFTIRQGLSVSAFTAVDNVTVALRADKPEIYAIAGESGSGKTTFAKMVLGLVKPTGGQLQYKNRDVTTLSASDKRRWFFKEVQPIFQDPFATFSPLKRIDSYLYETARNHNIVKKGDAEHYIDEMLQVVGLSLGEVRGRYPNELSGGQAQRVSIARALITQPSLLIADEPVSMLDASLRMSIVNLFKQLRDEQKVSVLYITHDLATAYYAADRIAIMLRGWIVETGPVESVLGNPLHPYSRILKDAVPKADPDRAWDDNATLAINPKALPTVVGGCKFAGRCPAVMDQCHHEVPQDVLVEGRVVKCFLYTPDSSGFCC